MPFLAGAIVSLSMIAETPVPWEAWDAVRCCNRLQVFQLGCKTSQESKPSLNHLIRIVVGMPSAEEEIKRL